MGISYVIRSDYGEKEFDNLEDFLIYLASLKTFDNFMKEEQEDEEDERKEEELREYVVDKIFKLYEDYGSRVGSTVNKWLDEHNYGPIVTIEDLDYDELCDLYGTIIKGENWKKTDYHCYPEYGNGYKCRDNY